MTPKSIIIHHTASNRESTTLENINEWHKERWPDFKSVLGYWIGYHFVILGDGQVIQTRQETEEGAHTLGGWNQKSIGICLTGSFNDWEVAEAQKNALQGILVRLATRYDIPKSQIYSHRELWATACPGDNLQRWIEQYRKPQFSVQEQIQAIMEKIEWVKAELKKLLGL